MSGPDFLTRLVERSLGSAPTVRPLVPPLYAERPGPVESAPVEERWEERPAPTHPSLEAATEPAPAVQARTVELRPDRVATADPRRREPPGAPVRPAPLAPTVREPDTPAAGKRAPGPPAPASPLEPPPGPVVGAPLPKEASSIPRATVEVRPPAAKPPPAPVSQPSTPPLKPLAVRRRDTREPAPRTAETEPREPTIRVTIGRVEVRAVNKPAEPQPSARPEPEQTLAEYLREAAGRRAR